MKRVLNSSIGFLVAICLMLVLQAQQQPAPSMLPQRDQVTVQDLKEQIADCTVSARAEANYEAKLIARITELEKQVAALKKPAASPEH